MKCETTDYMFPLSADIYYPIIEQGTYGNIKKEWTLDRTIACQFSSGGSAFKEEITPNVNITQDTLLIGRVRNDIRFSSLTDSYALTNIIITNIKDKSGNPVYIETSGPRVGKSTIYEIATFEPIVGAFGNVDYYKVSIRRSQNQGTEV